MRDYGRVYSKFWTSKDIQDLNDDGRLLALYLLSGPHGTIAGVCRLPDGYVCEDLKWSPKRVSKGFFELFRKGFAKRCETTDWVWICRFLTWNTPENPNQWKAARKIAYSVPTECSWIAAFHRVFAIAAGEEPPPDPSPGSNGSGTLSKPLPTQDQDQEQYQKQDQEQKQEAAAQQAGDPNLDQLKLIYPKRAGSQRWPEVPGATRARIREGHTWEEILAGAERYAAFIRATGKERTEHVQQAATFVGQNKSFLEPWDPPASKAEVRLGSNLNAAQEFMRRTEQNH